MSVNTDKRDRRDWTLIIFLLPIGILLMLVAGQIAIRMVPFWRVAGGMGSSLDPETASQQSGQVQPILFDIMTPMAWFDTFLTPQPDSAGEGIVFAPFVVFEPSKTPSPTAAPSLSNTPVTPSATPAVTATSTNSSPPAKKPTKKPPKEKPPKNPPPTSTPSPAPLVGVEEPVVPAEINIGTPDDIVGNVPDGFYVVIDLSGNPIIVDGNPDYDFVYYERDTGSGNIAMDRVILSISSDNSVYYVVFNWGDNVPDANTNVNTTTLADPPSDPANPEADNEPIDTSNLYQDPSAPLSPQTGILVDVDNAPSHPPNGNYSYLAVQAPVAPPSNDGADIDSIQVLP